MDRDFITLTHACRSWRGDFITPVLRCGMFWTAWVSTRPAPTLDARRFPVGGFPRTGQRQRPFWWRVHSGDPPDHRIQSLTASVDDLPDVIRDFYPHPSLLERLDANLAVRNVAFMILHPIGLFFVLVCTSCGMAHLYEGSFFLPKSHSSPRYGLATEGGLRLNYVLASKTHLHHSGSRSFTNHPPFETCRCTDWA